MTVDQVDKLMNRIKIHKPNFMLNYKPESQRELKEIWCDVLWDYDSEAVNLKLDEFLADINNATKNITVYSLVDGLTKKKYSDRDNMIECRICKSRINICSFDAHYERCNSIDYLIKSSRKYLPRSFNRSELNKLSDLDFEKLYWDCLKELRNKITSPLQKHLIENSIKTHMGQAPDLNLDDIYKELLKK